MKTMIKICSVLALMFTPLSMTMAQTAESVLDKSAALIGKADGVSATFRMESAQFGNTSGTILLKGRKFHASTPQASMWFDGETQWTYLQSNNEVTVITPTESQQQSINPYTFINLYKQGYKQTMTSSDKAHTIHLTAEDSKQKIQEVFITIDKESFLPSLIKMRQGSRWTTFYVSDMKVVKLSDTEFRFNSKDFPTAEVIDLR